MELRCAHRPRPVVSPSDARCPLSSSKSRSVVCALPYSVQAPWCKGRVELVEEVVSLEHLANAPMKRMKSATYGAIARSG